jgi:hypothetical protein
MSSIGTAPSQLYPAPSPHALPAPPRRREPWTYHHKLAAGIDVARQALA